MESLQKSLRFLSMLVMAFVIALISRNTFAVDSEKKMANPEVTAESHPMTATDVEITRKIRQQILKNKAMSLGAQNVKIISDSGAVTLKGMVASPAEKTLVGEIAQNIVGVNNVVNDTRIAKK